MEKVFYKEEQKFESISLYVSMGLIYATTAGVLLYGNIMQFVYNQPWGAKPMTNNGLLLTTVLVLLVLIISGYLLFGSRLVIEIDHGGINYNFHPFFKKTKRIPKESIKTHKVRKYKPIMEYGGWGIKKGQKGRGDAFNVSGNIGLQIVLKDGKRVLFGTQRPDAIKRAIIKLMN